METTTTQDVQITGIDISTFLVKDADRAIAFWRDKIGLRPTKVFEGKGAEFELADGSTFGIWKMDDDSWQPGSGIMFAVPDIRRAIEYYRARGVQVSDPDESPVCHMAFAEDSEGNHFILHQRK
jgi:predicted enzyme related to lactoylglutathione lyase